MAPSDIRQAKRLFLSAFFWSGIFAYGFGGSQILESVSITLFQSLFAISILIGTLGSLGLSLYFLGQAIHHL